MIRPELSTLVVAWRADDDVAELVAAWPDDARFELLIVDQEGTLSPAIAERRANVRLLAPGANLGFGGGSNFAAREARGDLLLLLNPDARPESAALEALVAGFAEWPDAAGLVPRLVGFDGRPQSDWQLRDLPTPLALLAHALFWNPGGGRPEPQAGAAIEQPAAAALALRRSVFEALGGFDEAFFPAWFEDVDLAFRLAEGRHPLRYRPSALFCHRQGSSVGSLGYGAFLTAYNRNLCRYLDKHHAALWSRLYRLLAAPAALLRLVALPLRRPVRAVSRTAAARALWQVARGSLSGWAVPAVPAAAAASAASPDAAASAPREPWGRAT